MCRSYPQVRPLERWVWVHVQGAAAPSAQGVPLRLEPRSYTLHQCTASCPKMQHRQPEPHSPAPATRAAGMLHSLVNDNCTPLVGYVVWTTDQLLRVSPLEQVLAMPEQALHGAGRGRCGGGAQALRWQQCSRLASMLCPS